MQFMFLMYHYYHAEEVYNAIRIMITCYVWMTGFGNFSFFYIKQVGRRRGTGGEGVIGQEGREGGRMGRRQGLEGGVGGCTDSTQENFICLPQPHLCG